MSKSFWFEKRAKLLRTATHIDQFGDVYKAVNGAWWVFRDIEYVAGLKYPCFTKCSLSASIVLAERNIKHL